MTSDLIGREVKNHGSELQLTLMEHYQVISVKHICTFLFEARLKDGSLTVQTEPVDDAGHAIRILSIRE